MDIEFKDLCYTLQSMFKEEKKILKNLHGQFRSGELSAIMGASGSGKTTLLNILSGYRLSGVSGFLGVNDAPRDENILRKYSCYIRQEEIHQTVMTVQELMELAAKLKLNPNRTEEENQQLILKIINNFAIATETKTRVEDLSGGQRKQLSIALELINNPNILFLDEPTSGMDMVIVNQCMKMLRELAHKDNRTVICTMHTPSAAIFRELDYVYVLAKGQCVYQGSPSQLVPFLDSISLPCPISFNPADYVIELTESNEANLNLMCKAIGNGEWTWRAEDKIHLSTKIRQDSIETNIRERMVNRARLPTSNWLQFRLLFKRMMVQQFRNKVAIYIQIIHHLTCMILFSLLFANTGNDGTDIFLHLKFAMANVVLIAYTWIIIPVLTFPFEISLLSKEHFNKWYNLIPFYFAWTLTRIPLMITLTLVVTLPVYIMSGQPLETLRFCKFYLVCILILFSAESFGLAIASFFKITQSSVVGTYSIAPLLALAMYGFDFPDQIPIWMHFLTNFSFMRCGFAGLLISMMADNRAKLFCPDIYCHFADPNIILKFVGYDQTSLVFECSLLLLHIITFRIIAFIGMYSRIKVK